MSGVRLGGGGARSPLWRQIQADVYGHPVEIVEAEEGAAYGAALLAGVGAGAWLSVDDACKAIVKVASRVPPSPTAVAALRDDLRRLATHLPRPQGHRRNGSGRHRVIPDKELMQCPHVFVRLRPLPWPPRPSPRPASR